MKQTKSNSYNSTPFSSKENICPNAKFNTLNFENKKHLTPSMGTDPEFSIFNTINVNRISQPNTITTKSRADMQAIIEDFSNNHENSTKEDPYSHKSFLALLGLAIGKEDFSMEEAIEKCEEYEISCKDQLLNILESKEPTREWPLPLSNLLLTDLGHLRIMQICNKIENEEDLSDSEIQILQFLLPKAHILDTIDKGIVLDYYHDFRNKIDEKFNLVDHLVKEYTLRIQPKIRKTQDKMMLIKIEKRFRRFQKLHKMQINYPQLKSCLEGLNLTEDEALILFKYLYFIENDKVMELVDRKQLIQTQTCIKQILDKSEIPFAKQTVSRIQLVNGENTQVINDLLEDKTHLLELLTSKDQEIMKLNNSLTLTKLRLESQMQEFQREKKRELESQKAKYLKKIKKLEEENGEKDNIIQWYKNELDAAVQANQAEVVAKERHHIYRNAYKSKSHYQTRSIQSLEDDISE